MGFRLESGNNNEVNEAPVTSEQLSEAEEANENFDDCSLDEVGGAEGAEVSSESMEAAEDGFEDCEAKVEEMKEKNPELSEDDYADFDVYGSETDGHYVADVTYFTDGEIDETEAGAELQEAYDECEDPEDMDQLEANAEESGYIEVIEDEVVERFEDTELGDEVIEEEAQEKAEEQVEEQQEAAEEYQEDLEKLIDESEDGVPEGTADTSILDEIDESGETEETSEAEEEVSEDTEESDEETGESDETTDEADEETDESDEHVDEADEDVDETSGNTEEPHEVSEDTETTNEMKEIEESTDDITEVDESTEADKAEADLDGSDEVSEFDDVTEGKEQHDKDTDKTDESTEEWLDETAEDTDEIDESTDESGKGVEKSADKAEEVDEAAGEFDEGVEESVKETEESDESTDESDEDTEETEETVDELNGRLNESEGDTEENAETTDESDETDDTERDLEAESIRKSHEVAEEGLEIAKISKQGTQYNKASELKELTSQRDEHAEALAQAKEEAESLSKENAERFDTVMKVERGTDSFKQALLEYNASRDRQADLESQIKDMEATQTELNSKTVELRTAQLQKGEVAAVASISSLAMSEDLQNRFDEAFYDGGSKDELLQIQTENSNLIAGMSSERDSVQLAMDAKMSEIRDYVYQNDLERFDTERDPHYQQLIAEYRNLDSTYNQLKYNVIKLDENNIQIAEVTGSDYESIRYHEGSQISEVNNGTDIPGRTNYFIDEARTTEVLIPFRQNNWENLTIREQKVAVEQLAAHNANILGIDNPPLIIYYKNDDPKDFGKFSPSQHTIYINELNMRDAAKTADTISHEYRHCYQHQRAELLETERDLEYKEGFDNYISPENNYLAYENQLVERDAREYADAVKDKINSLEDGNNNAIREGENTVGNAKQFEALNPEKEAVFDETLTQRFPEDIVQKIVEVQDPKEVFEVSELQEIKDQVVPTYDNGAKIAERIEEFNTYKEHHKIDGGHIGKVHDKSLQAADVLEQSFAKESYGDLYSETIDRKSLELMALYHDTGMDGNVSAEAFEQAKQEYLAEPGRREAYVSRQLAKKPEMTEAQANSKFEREAYESQFRKEHSVQSAIHALRDREFIEGHGANADRVALGCLAHSKSNSGIGNLADEGQWNDAVNRLHTAVAEFNKLHPDEQISFSDSFLRKSDGAFDSESLAEMRSEVLCLRIGDANGHDSGSHISQNGKAINFDLSAWKEVQDNLPEDLESKIASGNCSDFKAEVANAHVEIDGEVLDDTNDSSGFSRMFAVGEGNFKAVNLEMKNGVPTQKFELENSDAYPLSTQYCILERLKEYNTAKVDPQFEIARPAGMSDDEFKEYQSAQIDAMQKINFVAEIDLKQADGRTIASYEAFADKVKDQYGIEVKICQDEPPGEIPSDVLKKQISIDELDKIKIDNWKYRPADEVYLKHKQVFDNPKYYNQETGEVIWPPKNGVEGELYNKTLNPGEVIDRYGLDDGYYTAPAGTPYGHRSLAPGTENKPYSKFEIIKPITVEAGKVVPWFDAPGGGEQYKMPFSIEDLIDEGYIRRIEE